LQHSNSFFYVSNYKDAKWYNPNFDLLLEFFLSDSYSKYAFDGLVKLLLASLYIFPFLAATLVL